jgi:hypothetical protein
MRTRRRLAFEAAAPRASARGCGETTVDAPASEAGGLTPMGVRIPPPALTNPSSDEPIREEEPAMTRKPTDYEYEYEFDHEQSF